MYVNTRQPNLTVKGKAGWCLSVTQDVWSVPHLYTNPPNNRAITAWNDSAEFNHAGELPPKGVYSIAYWSFTDPTDKQVYWHIATAQPDGKIYSSPFDMLYGAQTFASVSAMTQRIQKIDRTSKYIGWSEGLSRVRLVKQGGTMVENTDAWFTRMSHLVYQITHEQLSRAEFATFVGRNPWDVTTDILDDVKRSQGDEAAASIKEGAMKSELAKLTTENTELKAKLALQGEDTKNLNALGTALQWFVKRTGLK